MSGTIGIGYYILGGYSIAGGTGNGTAVTLLFDPALSFAPYSANSYVSVERLTPNTINGVFQVVSSNASAVIISANTAGTITGPGTVVATATPTPPVTQSFVITAVNSANNYRSINGTTWTQGGNLPASDRWGVLGYGGGRYVALVGGDDSTSSDQAAVSTDFGVTWVNVTMPTATYWQSVTYGGGVFVATYTNAGSSYYSSDGLTWTEATMPVTDTWADSVYDGTKFVAISRYLYTATSPDGITWNDGGQTSASAAWQSIAYGNGVYVAAARNDGSGSSTDLIFSSTNGTTWTSRTLPQSSQWSTVVYGNGRFVVVSGVGSFLDDKTAYSTNGTTWTQGGSLVYQRRWQLAYNSSFNKFIAVGYGGSSGLSSNDTYYTTTDGVTWTEETLPEFLVYVTVAST